MKNEFKKIAKIFALFILGFSFAVVPAANYALSSVEQIDNVIVVFNDRYDDSAITESVETILSTYPKSNVILYESKEFQQISNKYFVQNYIFIGHGSESGVDVKGQILSWEAYGHMASSLHGSYFYFVHCQSDNIDNYFPMAKIGLVIPGIIDATIAGLLTSAMIAARDGDKPKAYGLIEQTAETLNHLEKGSKVFSPLYSLPGFPNLKDGEVYLSLAELFLIILAIVAGEAVLASGGAQTGMLALAGARIGHYQHKFLEIIHLIAITAAVFELCLVMFEMLADLAGDIGTYLLPYLNWVELIIFGLSLGASIALIIASGSSYFWVRAIAYTIIIGIWSVFLINDANDPDNLWHQTSSGGGHGGRQPY